MERVAPREKRENQSADSLTHRLERIELLNDHRERAPATVCPIQTPTRRVSLPDMAGGRRRGLVPTVRSSQGAGKGMQREGRKGTRWDNPSCRCMQRSSTGLVDGESWRDRAGRGRGGVAEPISQAAHLSIGCGPVSGDVEYPRDSSEMGTSANSGETPDANARPCPPRGRAEYQQAGTHSPQSPPPSEGDRTGRPGTTDEQRAKNTESTRAAPQESGGQIHLMEDETASMRLTLQNRWQSGVLEKTMKITRPSNEYGKTSKPHW